jgi:hypothetical protein
MDKKLGQRLLPKTKTDPIKIGQRPIIPFSF